jgi:hypothetical protein
LVVEGIKTAIVLAKPYPDMLKKDLVLVSGPYAYGVLQLGDMQPISESDFSSSTSEHQISAEEAKKWWPEGSRSLYRYSFTLLRAFLPPRPVKLPEKPGDFLSSVVYRKPEEIREEVEGLTDWNVLGRLGEAELKHLHQTLVELAKVEALPLEELVPKFQSVRQELVKRGLKALQSLPGDKAPTLPSGEIAGERIQLRSILPAFQDFDIKNPFIYLTGGIVNNGYTDNDIEILIRESGHATCPHCGEHMEHRNVPVEFRILRMLPEALRDRVHFLYDPKNFGPFTSHIPLFNLGLKRLKADMVRMQEARHNPTKPTEGTEETETIEKDQDRALTRDEETEVIRFNKVTRAAQKPHAFVPAKFVHGNGHPRCLICGSEEMADDKPCEGLGGEAKTDLSPYLSPTRKAVKASYSFFRKRAKGLIALDETEAMQAEKTRMQPRAKKEGDKSKAENKVVPMRFFYMPKAVKGYREGEVYSIPGVVEQVADFPVIIDRKFDGLRAQVHRQGDKVLILSEQGSDYTSRFPTVVKEMKEQKPASFVVDAEVELWIDGEHRGRSEVAGYANANTPADDSGIRFNIHDLVFLNGEDIHEQTQEERKRALDKNFKTTKHVKFAEWKLAKNASELTAALKHFQKQPGSEGGMVKGADAQYLLSGLIKKWLKYKKEADIDCEVIAKRQVVTTSEGKRKKVKAWNYACAIRDRKGEKIPVGITFNAGFDVPIGAIIRVAFVNINQYLDPSSGRTWFNWWAPRPIEPREDMKKPDSFDHVRNLVNETKGEKANKPYPSKFQDYIRTGRLSATGMGSLWEEAYLLDFLRKVEDDSL